MGLVQIKEAQGVTLTLRSYVNEQQKNEIHLLYVHPVFTSFLFLLCDDLVFIL